MPYRRLTYALLMILTACDSSSILAQVDLDNDMPAASVDTLLGEQAYTDEMKIAHKIAGVLEQSLRKRDAAGLAHRDVHSKAHGCVKANFHVVDDLPANLARGIFTPGHRYDAWIRFSNGSSELDRPDIEGDARGMAIKLITPATPSYTQDFILINHPVFFVNEPESYLAFTKRANSDSVIDKLLLPFSIGFKGILIVREMTSKTIPNPLQTRYWSMLPYQLGTGSNREAVKYSARACTADSDPLPEKPSPDYLRDSLRQHLDHSPACMEFLVQPRTSPDMSIEDSMTEWPEKEAPFYTVAKIEIPAQVFDTVEQNTFCENLSFNPWHADPAHKPLSATNRIRKIIYEHLSRVRNELNHTPDQEPVTYPLSHSTQ